MSVWFVEDSRGSMVDSSVGESKADSKDRFVRFMYRLTGNRKDWPYYENHGYRLRRKNGAEANRVRAMHCGKTIRRV